MDNLEQLFKQLKPLLLAITYGIVLFLLLSHITLFLNFILKVVGILKPAFVGFVIAYILNIPMKKIEDFIMKYCNVEWIKKHKRKFSVPITIILALLLVILLICIIVPQLVNSISTLIRGFGSNVYSFLKQIENLLATYHIDNEVINNYLTDLQSIPWSKLVKKALEFVSGYSSTSGIIVNDIYNYISHITNNFATFFAGFMMSLYFLSDKESFAHTGKKVLYAFFKPSHADIILKEVRKANEIYSNFIGGQLIECCILCALFFAVLTICRFPYALLISVITAVLALVPIFGAMLAMVIGFFLILPSSFVKAVVFCIVYQCLQQFENNLIYPRVVGQSVGLPGVYVLISILLLGHLWGVVGMIISVPTGALIYQIIKDIVNAILKKKRISDEDIDTL